MKFRILRNYDKYRSQVDDGKYWADIGRGSCDTLEEAEKVCADYKRMKEDFVVKEFEL